MKNQNYNLGDILEVENELAYLQYDFGKNKFGVTYSKRETPLNLIGNFNRFCLGDGVIDDATKYKKLDIEEHVKKFGENPLTRKKKIMKSILRFFN